MACNTSLTSILKSCDNNVGGLTSFYIAPSEFVSASTVTAGEVTAITMSGASTFVEFQFNKNSASYTEEAAIDLTNGSTYYTETVTLTIPRRDVDKRNAIALIAAGQRDLKIIVKDGNGIYWFVGYANSANLTALAEGSGAAKADGSKYTLTFVAEEPELMYTVDSAIIAAII
jgi:hypothetical protein